MQLLDMMDDERLTTVKREAEFGMLICVSGPSGVGKGTVIDALMKLEPKLIHSISVTTRQPRKGEVDGVHYYFRTKEEFEQMLDDGEILEHDVYVDNYYGTPAAPIERQLQEGYDVIMDVTVPGSLATMEYFSEAVTIFLLPPSLSELRGRLKHRGTESDQVIDSRLLKALDEIEMAPRFQYNVVNDNLDQTCEAISKIIAAERYKSIRQPGLTEHILKT